MKATLRSRPLRTRPGLPQPREGDTPAARETGQLTVASDSEGERLRTSQEHTRDGSGDDAQLLWNLVLGDVRFAAQSLRFRDSVSAVVLHRVTRAFRSIDVLLLELLGLRAIKPLRCPIHTATIGTAPAAG